MLLTNFKSRCNFKAKNFCFAHKRTFVRQQARNYDFLLTFQPSIINTQLCNPNCNCKAVLQFVERLVGISVTPTFQQTGVRKYNRQKRKSYWLKICFCKYRQKIVQNNNCWPWPLMNSCIHELNIRYSEKATKVRLNLSLFFDITR